MKKYAENASKFVIRASSQSNESINRMMSHKAHKSDCFSLSEACDVRYASVVCTKNEGERYICDLRKKAQLTEGEYTARFADQSDSARANQYMRAKSITTKARRNELRVDRENLRKKSESAEGIQYQSGCGLLLDTDACNSFSDPSENTNLKLIADNYEIMYFDLETSGFAYSAYILQIAAKCGLFKFSIYATPTKMIDPRATEVTGLKNIGGELHLRGEKVDTIPMKEALLAFLAFLKSQNKPCLLVAHKAKFDVPRLITCIRKNLLIDDFRAVVIGFSDTLPLLKKKYPERKGQGMFKLEKLAVDILNIQANEKFHDALYDVEVLELLSVAAIDNADLFSTCKRFVESVNDCLLNIRVSAALPDLQLLSKVVSNAILRKIAIADITYQRLREVYQKSGRSLS